MAIAFKDVAGALGYNYRPDVDYILSRASLPAITPGQGQTLSTWMATANSISIQQTKSLIQFWPYSLGVTMAQIGVYCADNPDNA
jgi:hypothetical protein